jgi:hypothetical protein
MPPVVIAVAAAAASYGAAAGAVAAGLVAAGGFAATLIGSAAALAVSTAGGALISKKSRSNSMQQVAQDRTVSVRQPISPRQIVYGNCKVGGTVVYMQSTDNNKYLHMVVALAGHELASIDTIYFDDTALALDSGGLVTSGTYLVNGTSLVQIKKYLGTTTQTADAGLIAASGGKWTTAHRGQGVAYLYVRLTWNQTAFPSGIPNITAVVKGKKVFDPRFGTTGYSNNAALCIRDYLLTPVKDGGIGATAAELDATNWIAAANLCDESVPVVGTDTTEKRYTLNGTIALSDSNTPKSTLENMLTSCGGTVVYAGGKWRLLAAAYRTPTVTLTEADLRGGIQMTTRVSRREQYNAVKGTYISPDSSWQPTDYPAIVSNTAMAEDGGERVFREIDRPFTTSAPMAQRLGKIELLRGRQPITIQLPCKLTAFRVQAGDVVYVSNTRFGWTNKAFEVREWQFAVSDDGLLGIDLSLRETDGSIYDWSTSEEQTIDPAPNTNLPDWRNVGPPTNLAVTSSNSQVIEGTDGSLISRAIVSWTASVDAFVARYEVQYRIAGETTWTYTAETTGTSFPIDSIPVGTVIDVQVRAVNSLGTASNFVSIFGHTITGYSTRANPAVTNLKVVGSVAGSPGVFNTRDVTFQWDATTIGILFDSYIVEIRNVGTNALRRTFATKVPTFTYDLGSNTIDGLNRTFVVSVQVKSRLSGSNALSTATTLTATNAAPALPTGITLSGDFRTINLRYTPPAEEDWAGIQVWASTTSGFTPGSGNLVYQGPDTLVVWPASPGVTFYVRYACYDVFGTSGLNVSGESVVSTTKISHAELMAEVIDSTNLYPSLQTSINKIDVIETAVSTETTARQTADSGLAARIDSVTATSAGFDATLSYRFDATAESWTASGATATWQSAGTVRLTSSTTNPQFISPAFSIAGTSNRVIKVRVTRIAGSGWTGTALYQTSSRATYSSSFRKTIADPALAIGSTTVLSFDMSALTAGGTEWTTSTITRIRLDLGATSADIFDVDWVVVGSEAPAASTAALIAEQTARADGDTAVANSVTTLQTTVNGHTSSISTQATSINGLSAQYTVKVDVNGYVSGFGLASTAINGTPTSDFIVNADRFSIAKPGTGGLSAPVIPFIVSTKGATPVLSFAGYASIDKLLTGTLDTETLYVGATNVIVDGPSRAIRVNDGTRDRVRIGKQLDNSYGITILDAAGNTILASGSGLGAGVVTSANLASGAGVNLVYNSNFPYSVDGWGLNDNSTAQTPTLGRNLNSTNIIPGTGLAYIQVPGTPTTGTAFTAITLGQSGSGHPVVAGRRYEASIYCGMYRAAYVAVALRFYNAAGAILSTTLGNQVTNTTQFTQLSHLGRSSVFVTAPTGATTAVVLVWVQCNGGTNPYGLWTQAYLGEAGTNQTELSAWVPGPTPLSTSGVSGLGSLATANNVDWNTNVVNIPAFGGFAYLSSITSANISTYISSAAIGTAYISDLSATKLTAGTIASANINVTGGLFQVLDGASNVRVLIGNWGAQGYGLFCRDATGTIKAEFSSVRNYLDGAVIEDLTVTNAKIGNLSVSGTKIEDLAVSNANMVEAVSVNVPQNSAVTAATLTITTTGQPIFILAAVANFANTGQTNGAYRVKLNGTDISGIRAMGAFQSTVPLRVAAAAGTHTITLTFDAQASGSATGAAIYAQELRK